MTEYRASFDAAIRFGNGGDLTAHGFRVDVPSPDTDEDAIAALFVASLGLLMTDSVTLTNVEVFAEPHKGTRGGPSDHSREGMPAAGRLVELNHVIRAGMVTYPGLPGPQITPYRPGKLRASTTPRAPNSPLTGLVCSATPAPISTRPITGTATGRTSAVSPWPGPPSCRPWWSV